MPDRHELYDRGEQGKTAPELALEYLPYTPEGMLTGTIAVPKARSFLVVDRKNLRLYIDGKYEFSAEELDPSAYEPGHFGLMRVVAGAVNQQGQPGEIFGFVADIRKLRKGDITTGDIIDQQGEAQWYNRGPLGIRGFFQRDAGQTVYAGDPMFRPFADNLLHAMDELQYNNRLPTNVYEREVVVGGVAKAILAGNDNVIPLITSQTLDIEGSPGWRAEG